MPPALRNNRRAIAFRYSGHIGAARARMTRLCTLTFAAVALASCAGVAAADPYPVAGRWTYDHASEPGRAKTCTGHIMEFRGEQRFDTGGGVSQYRNVSVNRASQTQFAVIDEFFNVMIRGRVPYMLRVIDDDHIELHLEQGGAVIPLRRCG
jgi:hypothetical protein